MKRKLWAMIGALALLTLAADQPIASARPAPGDVGSTAGGKAGRAVSEAELRAHIAILASDEFGGREPGTSGEDKTIGYLAEQWERAGLKPLGNSAATGIDAWFQPVALESRSPAKAEIRLRRSDAATGSAKAASGGNGGGASRGAGALILPPGQIAVRSSSASAELTEAPVLFVPGVALGETLPPPDVKGALVLLLISDPRSGATPDNFRARRAALFEGGAAAVLGIVGADLPWPDAQRSFASPSLGLAALQPNQQANPGTASGAGAAAAEPGRIDGVISLDAADQIFQLSGVDLTRVAATGNGAPPQPVALNLAASGRVEQVVRRFTSHNVVGYVPAARPTRESVLMLGHWDHLGECGVAGADDRICNGAVDNASGLAIMTAVAKRVAAGPPPDRNIIFLATTAEERGLLGARAFMAGGLTLPHDGIVAAFNVDSTAIAPRGLPVAIIGRGSSLLNNPALIRSIDAVARKLGRRIDRDTDANVMIQRQDGWALLSRGVPTVMVSGSFSDMRLLEAYLAGTYHGPDDELTDALPLGGAAEDADLHVALLRHFASRKQWPAKARGAKAQSTLASAEKGR